MRYTYVIKNVMLVTHRSSDSFCDKKSIQIGKRSPLGLKSILADQKTRLLQNISNIRSLNNLN